MNRITEIEIKVGIFVALGTVLIMLAIIILGGAEGVLTRQNIYHSHFPAADGLIGGAKVVLNGITVGTVDAVDFDPKTRDIQVSFKIQKKYESWIREDSTAEISTQGVLGDKYVFITVGSDAKPILSSGGKITPKVSQGLNQFLSKGDQLMITLNSISLSMDRILKSFEHGGRSEVFFQSMTQTSRNLAEASHKLNTELESIQLRSTVRNLNSILEKINNGTGTLGALINDPGLYYDTRALLGGANRNRIMRNLVRKTVKDGEASSAEEELESSPAK